MTFKQISEKITSYSIAKKEIEMRLERENNQALRQLLDFVTQELRRLQNII